MCVCAVVHTAVPSVGGSQAAALGHLTSDPAALPWPSCLPGKLHTGTNCLGHAAQPLCSLRVLFASITTCSRPPHTQVTPIMTGLGDRHPYVRRTAVMGVLKVAHIDPASVQQHGACWAAAGVCPRRPLEQGVFGRTGTTVPLAPGCFDTPVIGSPGMPVLITALAVNPDTYFSSLLPHPVHRGYGLRPATRAHTTPMIALLLLQAWWSACGGCWPATRTCRSSPTACRC